MFVHMLMILIHDIYDYDILIRVVEFLCEGLRLMDFINLIFLLLIMKMH
jgi:hypothetical protein